MSASTEISGNDMDIRTVTVELLRAGPRHNQLVSPLTQYLGVCGNAAAGRVSLPYEHGDLELRLQELRYRVANQDDRARRSKLLDRTGREVAQILSAIPGVSGLLNPEDEQPRTLTHLRIVLSASELAMLPFEASKVPTGEDSMSTWLALQARAPVCITRHIRSVSAEGIRWPSEPRILFVAGPDTDAPLALHRKALADAMAPWRNPDGRLGDRLVVLEKATLAYISREVAAAAAKGTPFTHVHILAHGAPLDETDRYSPVGLALHDEDVISGRQLATALIAVADRGVSRPVVVTLATCDSGKVSDVRTTDASVAHDLHDQGIPLVVASQFPLSVDGSVPFVERFYQGQLWGEHPLVSLYAVRLHLHSCMGPDTHDWASLVVYEAFPSNLADQLEELRYWQARRAQEGALRRVEALVAQGDGGTPFRAMPNARDRYEAGLRDVEAMSARLPTEGPYALECAGLRAAGHKRIAQAAFQMAVAGGAPDGESDRLLAECLNRLEQRARRVLARDEILPGPLFGTGPTEGQSALAARSGPVAGRRARPPTRRSLPHRGASRGRDRSRELARRRTRLGLCQPVRVRAAAPRRSEHVDCRKSAARRRVDRQCEAASLRCWVADPSMLPPRRGSSNATPSGGAIPIFNGRLPSWACPSVRTGM